MVEEILASCTGLLSKGSKKHIPLTVLGQPVPASRPRVSKWGTYYGKNYTRWRKTAEEALEELKETHAEPVAVMTRIVCLKPKTTKRAYPRGDNDNFEKSIWDAVTKSKAAWNDDDQVILNITTKQYTTNEDDAGFYVDIFLLEDNETKTC